jgi:hypothetical protein
MTADRQNCPWCDVEYSLVGDTSAAELEQRHLVNCEVFQTLPVAEMTPDGRAFVEYEPGILVERRRKTQ